MSKAKCKCHFTDEWLEHEESSKSSSKSLLYLLYDWNPCQKIRWDCFRYSCRRPKTFLKMTCSGPIQNYGHAIRKLK